MPVDEPMPAPTTLRQRRRAAATQEILDTAESHIAEHGAVALSLRAVARSLGMTVQALYHYFPSRDALVTALVEKAHSDLADAVQTAVDTTTEVGAVPRLVAAAEGYRRWAVTRPEHFKLIYGTPLRSYAAPAGGPSTQAVLRMSAVFERELFAGYTRAQLAAADTPALSPPLLAYLEQLSPQGQESLPPAATSLLLSAWGHLHGLVVLEVFGHTSFLGDHQAEIFRMAMRNMAEEIHGRIPHA
ncbi:TetR/AcrR family transcriptional regulator [Streptomyces sp. NPDC088124]|uniref:TetR/AcrR family transcriptional regulator n=1 Tax=Streptomyces sp. NPDC088124 TaxID=3154654 RepID=UPI00341E7012